MGQSHYFSGEPDSPSSPRPVPLDLPDLHLDLVADGGVFSSRQIDPGTRVLLEHMPAPQRPGDLLDLGCGYGPIALTLAARHPDRTVWAVDVNSRALELARRNADAAGLGNVRVCRPEEVPAEIAFAAVYSHPPIRIGKVAMHDLLLAWLSRLAERGAAYLVVQRNLGSDSLATWLAGQGFPATRLRSVRGYRILRVSARESGRPPTGNGGRPAPVEDGRSWSS